MADWFTHATRGSECGTLARGIDWSRTSLGDPATWPTSLRSAVEMCFSTRFPVLVTWGPELTMIYNDAYRVALGRDLHPAALGAPVRRIWNDVWDVAGPRFQSVLETGQPSWDVDLPLRFNRSGFHEETRFTFSLSPLRDDAGAVRGVLDIAFETTDEVIDRRRLRTLRGLTGSLIELGDDMDTLAEATARVLADSADVEAVQIYLRRDDGRFSPTVLSEAGILQDAVSLVAATGSSRWVGTTLVAPLAANPSPAGVIVLSGNPGHPFNDSQRSFLTLIFRAVDAALGHGLAHQREVAAVRRVADSLQRSIRPEFPISPQWAAQYRPADEHLTVGGDWYDVVRLGDGRFGLVVGDCVGHGLDAAVRMGQLRSAGRALLLARRSPAQVLGDLDEFADTLPGGAFTTVFCGVVDERSRTLTYSSGGHPPGLVIGADGSVRWLDGARGTPLTIRLHPRTQQTVHLTPDDTVILYSDGLVERRGESLRVGLDRLAAAARTLLGTHALHDLPEALVDALVPPPPADDVALVVYRAVQT